MKWKHLEVAVGVFLAFTPLSWAGELVLVEDGVSRAPIVVFEDAPPYTQEAAEELAVYIEKTSGAKPTLIEGAPDPIPEHAIWVGMQPAVRELFPRLDLELAHPEEILIAANQDHLLIAGRDRWDPDHLVVEGIDEQIKGKQQEYGTVNAVYTFLQKYLDVRWLWPGELGEDIAEEDTIAFAPFEYRYHPQMQARGGVFNFSSLSNRGYGRAHRWTRRQRLQLSSLRQPGGHAFNDWWERFHETHPDYFALQPDGTRSGFPRPKYAKLCQSNPAVWEQWLEDVEQQLRDDPTRRVFNASPNDSWLSGHCVCEDCSAWDHPEGERRMFHWQDHKEMRVALSDRHVTFANKLAGLLNERYPDKDYYVLMLSYGHSRPAPVEAVPADNVIISSVANYLGRTHLKDRGSPQGTTHREQLAAWAEIAPNIMWRPNTGSPAGWQQGLPDLSTRQTIEHFKSVADKGCMGIFIDSVWEHWAVHGPQYYAMAQLTWNPKQDAKKLLADYYQRGFGPAAEPIGSYFTLLEDARMEYVKEYGYGAGVLHMPKLYTQELLDKAEAELDRAESAVEDASRIYADRVAFVRTGFAYSRLLVETINMMHRYWQDPNEELAGQVKANWQTRKELCAAHPYAINWASVRPQTPRMRGLHPEHPNPKWDIKPAPETNEPEGME